MRKRTTTQKLHEAITNNLLIIESAESYSKTTHKADDISVESFKDSLDFLCETIFSDAVGWYFEWNYKTGNYEIDCGRMDRSSNFIITVYLRVGDGVKVEDADKVLEVIED